jgi:phage gp36-like protein
MALISPAYCEEADVRRLFSAHGVTAFADHDQDGESDAEVVNDCINQACEEINLYAQQRYTPAQLATSTLIARWTTTLACYFLCLRRGNPVPASIEGEFTRILSKLEQIALGSLALPGIALRDDMRPSMSNLTVDRRYPQSRIRVTPNNSTDAPTRLTQDTVPDIVPGVLD